jgi:hypothetical protein
LNARAKIDLNLIKIIFSSVAMFISLFILNYFYVFYVPGNELIANIFNILLVGIFGTFVYFSFNLILRVNEIKYFYRLFK